MNVKKKVAVYIGRFQPLHNGHMSVINYALTKYDALVVCIGSSSSARTIKNPFNDFERELMLHHAISTKCYVGLKNKVGIVTVADYPYNDNEWVAETRKRVQDAINSTDLFNHQCDVEITIVGSERDPSTWYLRAFPDWGLDLVEPFPIGSNMSATELRERWFDTSNDIQYVDENTFPDVPESTRKVMRRLMYTTDGVITEEFENLLQEYKHISEYRAAWSTAPYAPTFVTADAVVFQSGHVLVVQRGQHPGKGLIALPGGFIKQNERVSEAAIRELVEETGLKIPIKVLRGSVKATEVFDHPERSLRGRTITFASLIQLDDTQPLPRVKGQNVPDHESGGKEIVETTKAFWMPLDKALSKPEMWFEDHYSIIRWAVAHHNFSSASPLMKR